MIIQFTNANGGKSFRHYTYSEAVDRLDKLRLGELETQRWAPTDSGMVRQNYLAEIEALEEALTDYHPKEIVATIEDDIDRQGRQFIWYLYEDGSAMTRELTKRQNDFVETWRKLHPFGSEEAVYIERAAIHRGVLSASLARNEAARNDMLVRKMEETF